MEKCCRAEQTAGDNIRWRMSISCWITRATNTHSEYVIFSAFPLQHRLHERVSLSRHKYCTFRVLLGTAITSGRQLKINILMIAVFKENYFRTGLVFQLRVFSNAVSQNINTCFPIPTAVRPILISLTVCSTQYNISPLIHVTKICS